MPDSPAQDNVWAYSGLSRRERGLTGSEAARIPTTSPSRRISASSADGRIAPASVRVRVPCAPRSGWSDPIRVATSCTVRHFARSTRSHRAGAASSAATTCTRTLAAAGEAAPSVTCVSGPDGITESSHRAQSLPQGNVQGFHYRKTPTDPCPVR